ncbi:MAG: aminodeoxychorismate synthase component I, partial [Priestia megaterium]
MQQRMTWGESISISKNQWFKKYQELSKEEPNHILLESGRGGKFQMMGLKPVAILRGEQNELHIKMDGQA